MTVELDRFPIFDAVRKLRGGIPFLKPEVDLLDDAINDFLAGPPPVPPPLPSAPGRKISPRGIAFIHSFESLRLVTYKDPGSKNGLPITGGWGSTRDHNGRPFQLGVEQPRQYWDDLFCAQIGPDYADQVDALLGDTPTTQDQFDAMVSLTYNIGIGSKNLLRKGGFTRSTVLRLHRAGDHKGAARAFLMWNKNDGKEMRGLTRRRMAESDLYLYGTMAA